MKRIALHPVLQGLPFILETPNDDAGYIKEIHMYSKTGDPVEYFDNASKALGILIMEFTDRSFRDRIMSEIRDHIITVLEEDLTACGSDYQVLPQTV